MVPIPDARTTPGQQSGDTEAQLGSTLDPHLEGLHEPEEQREETMTADTEELDVLEPWFTDLLDAAGVPAYGQPLYSGTVR